MVYQGGALCWIQVDGYVVVVDRTLPTWTAFELKPAWREKLKSVDISKVLEEISHELHPDG